MDKETLDKIESLRLKIEERITGKNLEGVECTLNADELNEMLKNAFLKYNEVLIDKVEKDRRSINKLITQGRLFNKKIPYIACMTPTIYEDGREEIIVAFEYDKKCKGIAAVDKDLNVIYEFMKNDYSIDDTTKFLNRNKSNFITYFEALDSFSFEFPGVTYEWNQESRNVLNVYEVDDGFVNVKFDLRHVGETKATLSSIRDLELARTRVPKHGEIYDYVDFYNTSILRSVRINEEELNPLYKKIVEKSRREEQGIKRVLTK